MSDTLGAGRPEIDKEEVFRKLEPYLKSGLSVPKACIEAHVPKSTVYDHIEKDNEFSERIVRAQQFLSVMLTNAMVKQLHTILKKQSEDKPLEKEEVDFMKWFAVTSNLTRGEFGERKGIEILDPEIELRKLMGIIQEEAKKDE